MRVRRTGVPLAWGCAWAAWAGFGCAPAQAPFAPPGYTRAAAAPSTAVVSTTEPPADAEGPLWPHVAAVLKWSEVFHGQTIGHAFSGSAAATVSTRVSDATMADVVLRAKSWNELAPGSTVSQLVLVSNDAPNWSVAYVAERLATELPSERAQGAGVMRNAAFYLVTPDGQVHTSAADSCASCHSQRGNGRR